MKGKDNNKRAEPALESNSMELFEEIFKQATMEIRIEKEGRAQKQKYTPVLAPSRGLRQELKAAEKKVIKQSKPAAEGPKGKRIPCPYENRRERSTCS